VSLQGVTIGNVQHVRIVPDRTPTSVEVTMKVDHKYLKDLHIDSTAAIAQAGVLGDSLWISTRPMRWATAGEQRGVAVVGHPGIQDVIRTSQVSIEEANRLIRKIQVLTDTLNTNRGTVAS